MKNVCRRGGINVAKCEEGSIEQKPREKKNRYNGIAIVLAHSKSCKYNPCTTAL